MSDRDRGEARSRSQPDAGIVDTIHRAFGRTARSSPSAVAPGLHEEARERLKMRSLLFVPGDSARKLEKALGSGA